MADHNERRAAHQARRNPGMPIVFYKDNGSMGWVTYDADTGSFDIIRRK